jgi:hypothetical protein
VFGPIVGSSLSQFSLSVPLYLAGVLSSLALIFAFCELKETHPGKTSKKKGLEETAEVEKDVNGDKTLDSVINTDATASTINPEVDVDGKDETKKETQEDEPKVSKHKVNWTNVVILCAAAFFTQFAFLAFS